MISQSKKYVQLFTLKKSKTSNFQKLCRARVSSGINSYALVFHHRHREWTPEGKTNTITAGPNCMQLNSAKVYTNQYISSFVNPNTTNYLWKLYKAQPLCLLSSKPYSIAIYLKVFIKVKIANCLETKSMGEHSCLYLLFINKTPWLGKVKASLLSLLYYWI